MKKVLIKTIMFVVVAATFIACEEEDSNIGTNSSLIVGTWDQLSEKSTYTVNGQVVNDTTINFPPDSFLMTFSSNGMAYTSTRDTLKYIYGDGKISLISYYDGIYDTSVLNAVVTNTNLTLSITHVDSFQGKLHGFFNSANFRRK